MEAVGTFDTPPLEGLAVENASKDLPVLPAARAPLRGASGLSLWHRPAASARVETVVQCDASLLAALKAEPDQITLNMSTGAVTSDGLATLARTRCLRHVGLSWATDAGEPSEGVIVDAEAIATLASCPLDSLALDCCVETDLTDAIIAICERTTTLRHLSLYECCVDSEEVMAALGRCASLRTLDWHAYATDIALWELVQGGAGGTETSWLEALRLSPYQETALSDDAILAIAASCPRLATLDVTDAADGGVTDEGVRALAGALDGVKGCRMLRRLDVGSRLNPHITDKTIALLCDGAFPRLERVGFAGCTAISQTALRALAFRRPSLCVSGLEVASVAQIVDELTEGVGFGAAWGMGEAEAEVSEASSEASEEGGSERTLGESGEDPASAGRSATPEPLAEPPAVVINVSPAAKVRTPPGSGVHAKRSPLALDQDDEPAAKRRFRCADRLAFELESELRGGAALPVGPGKAAMRSGPDGHDETGYDSDGMAAY